MTNGAIALEIAAVPLTIGGVSMKNGEVAMEIAAFAMPIQPASHRFSRRPGKTTLLSGNPPLPFLLIDSEFGGLDSNFLAGRYQNLKVTLSLPLKPIQGSGFHFLRDQILAFLYSIACRRRATGIRFTWKESNGEASFSATAACRSDG
jgi:hypothetical protein